MQVERSARRGIGCGLAVAFVPVWIVSFVTVVVLAAPSIQMVPTIDGRPDPDGPISCDLGHWVFAEPKGQGVEVDYMQRQCVDRWWEVRHVRRIMLGMVLLGLSVLVGLAVFAFGKPPTETTF